MPLRRNDFSFTKLCDQFWERESKGVLVSFPSNEKHWPLNAEDVLEKFSAFAEKYPKGCVSIEKRYFYETRVIDKIIMTIAFDKWIRDKIVFSVGPRQACGIFYVICHLDVERMFPIETNYIYNCNVEETLKGVDVFIKNFSKNRERMANIPLVKEKENKLLDMAEKSIETIVPQMMASSNYEWNLFCEETRYVLSIKMKKHKMIQISLTPKNFANKIQHILNVVSRMEKLLDEIPFPVDIKGYGNNIKWRKGTECFKK